MVNGKECGSTTFCYDTPLIFANKFIAYFTRAVRLCRSPPFQNEPSFLATVFLTCNHFLFIIVFPCSYSNNNCDLLLNAPLLIDMLSQNFY